MNNVGTPPMTALRLSRAELYVLARLLKATRMAGIDFTWFQAPPVDLPPEARERAVDEAVKALVSRGYLVPLEAESNVPQSFAAHGNLESGQQNWKTVGIPEEIMTLLAICAFPEQSLALTWNGPGGAKLLWLHTREQAIVAVTSPLPDIYQFTALPDWDTVQHIILKVLGLKEQQAPRQLLGEGKLQIAVLFQAREALENNDPAQALARLTDTGLSEPAALAFLEAISTCTTIARLLVMRPSPGPDEHEQQAKLVTIITPATCFVLSQSSASETAYSVQAVSAAEVRAWITAAWSAQDARCKRSPVGGASNGNLQGRREKGW